VAAPSLSSRFAWTFAGNASNAFSQWIVLSLIAKLGDAEMLGRYALAVAIAAPVAMLSHMNLRAVVVVDVKGRHAAGDYLGFRYWTSGVGLAALALIAVASKRPPEVAAAIVLVGLLQAAEAVSDLYYAFWQRRERMDRVARSMILRGLLSALAAGAALWLWRSLLAAVAALAAVRLGMLLLVDRRAERRPQATVAWHLDVLRNALPLGLALMLGSLNTNLPRYLVEWSQGTKELGGYAAAASFITVGNTMIHALGQASAARLARAAEAGERARFGRLAAQLIATAVALGVAGVLTAIAIGEFVLRILYRPEYGGYRNVLVAVMAAAILQYLASALGYLLTSARWFAVQIPLLAAASIAIGVTGWLSVPRFGLQGAALALAAGAAVQATGAALLLSRAVRGMEQAA
jgi:O-antigen/teichoic acid export membrane protein